MLEDNIVINNFDNCVTSFGILILVHPRCVLSLVLFVGFFVLIKRCANNMVFVMVTL